MSDEKPYKFNNNVLECQNILTGNKKFIPEYKKITESYPCFLN